MIFRGRRLWSRATSARKPIARGVFAKQRQPRPLRCLLSILVLAGIVPACGRPQAPQDAAVSSGLVRFIALGDFGTGNPEQKEVANAMCSQNAEERFSYVVTTGDNVYPSGSPDDFQEKFFNPFDCLFEEDVRFHATLGNHDIETDGGASQINELRFGMPARYYSWRIRDVAFVMLDSNELDELDSPVPFQDEQTRWMRDQLEQARSSPWTVVVFHHPVFSSSTKHPSTPGFDELLAEPFSDLGVDLVLNGHAHNYQRATVFDVTYIVTGGGGASLYECSRPLFFPVTKCLSQHHFVEVEATPGGMSVTAIDEEGNTLDTVEVQANN